jgi:cardiolipin synthase A/B
MGHFQRGLPAVAEMTPENQISLLKNGEAYFPALVAALDQATHEIFLETYIFEDDATGRYVADALRRAACRGVETHMLIDGFGSNHLPQTMVDYLEEAGVMVLKFRSKISPWTLKRRRLRRLHRKIAVVDMKIAFVGGINIIDDTPIHAAPRYDYAVSVEGPLVKKIYTSTRRMWLRVSWLRLHSASTWRHNKPPPAPASKGCMQAAFLIRDNLSHRRDIEYTYLQAIEQARTEIILANAYFLPGLKFRHALLAAAKKGVRVVLLLQGKPDHPFLHYASVALYGHFLDAGIEIYEYHQSILHAKIAVIDEFWATVGSSNLDPFSLLLALEANVVVEDEGFARILKQSLEQAINTGAQQISKTTWRTQSIIVRLASWVCYGLIRFMTGLTGYASEENYRSIV